MHEPACSSAGELRAQLLDESYPKPFVIDDGKSRFLYFSVRLMQSTTMGPIGAAMEDPMMSPLSRNSGFMASSTQ
mgnify:CR=1 FL=1